MTMLAERARTPEELLRLEDGDQFELVDGEFVEKKMGAEASWIANRLARRITEWVEAHELGYAFDAECGFRCFSWAPSMVRKPDVSFVRGQNVAGGRIPKGFFQIPPDLAVEVVSPNDFSSEVRRKVREFLRAGTEQVWVVDPETRDVEVYRADGSTRLVRGDEELSGEGVLPGFRVPVSDLFPPVSTSADQDEVEVVL